MESNTKSIRLSPEESEILTQLSERTAIAEAALMKKWVQAGMRAEKLALAVQAYMDRKIDLRGGALMAGVSYNRFLQELQRRNIVILDDDRFLERLTFLADTFGDEILGIVVKEVVAGRSGNPMTSVTDQREDDH